MAKSRSSAAEAWPSRDRSPATGLNDWGLVRHLAPSGAIRYTPVMQYSLRTVMWALLALALLFAAPATTLWLVWMLLPTVLVALTLYGRAALRTFAIGSLVGYGAIALQRGGLGMQGSWLDLPLSLVVLGGSGWLMLQLRRWLIGRDKEPVPPPWQEN